MVEWIDQIEKRELRGPMDSIEWRFDKSLKIIHLPFDCLE